MAVDFLQVDRLGPYDEAPVLQVTVNRPEKRNALSREVLFGLRDIFTDQASSNNVKLAILTGAGDKSFAAGGDLNDLDAVRSLDEARAMAEGAKEALNAIRRFPLPVVAALNGDAMGGGAELAMACDFRVMARHARIGFVQARLNITSAWGGGVDLIRRVGPDRALGLLCRGEMIAGPEALTIGMVDRVAEDGEALSEAVEVFTALILRQAPQVLRGFKSLIEGARRGLHREDLDALETNVFAPTWVHEDHWKAVDRILSGKGAS